MGVNSGRSSICRTTKHTPGVAYLIGGHNLAASEPPPSVSGKVGRNPQDIPPRSEPPCRIRTQCTMSFCVARKGF